MARVVEGNEPGLRPEFFIRTNLQPIFAEADKKRAEGRAKRLAVLAGEGMRLSLDDICQQRILLGRHLVQVDDLIDAAACVLTAKIEDGDRELTPLISCHFLVVICNP